MRRAQALADRGGQAADGGGAEARGAGGFRPVPTAQPILSAVDFFKRLFDRAHGGVRRAPKFPSNIPIRLLLRHHRRTGDAESLRDGDA